MSTSITNSGLITKPTITLLIKESDSRWRLKTLVCIDDFYGYNKLTRSIAPDVIVNPRTFNYDKLAATLDARSQLICSYFNAVLYRENLANIDMVSEDIFSKIVLNPITTRSYEIFAPLIINTDDSLMFRAMTFAASSIEVTETDDKPTLSETYSLLKDGIKQYRKYDLFGLSNVYADNADEILRSPIVTDDERKNIVNVYLGGEQLQYNSVEILLKDDFSFSVIPSLI